MLLFVDLEARPKPEEAMADNEQSLVRDDQ